MQSRALSVRRRRTTANVHHRAAQRVASITAHAPTFRTLPPAECEAVLQRNVVGRLAFARHDQIDIEPINYAVDDGWLYGRTSPGSKMVVLAHHPWVAFEVDEVRGAFDWTSVVVHGTVYRFRPTGSRAERSGYDRAVTALRRLLPATLSAADPVPFRRLVFGIHIDRVTGRVATP